MEDSWRFRPIQGNICPTCSVSHFPFCPQPPSFDRNRFVVGETNQTFHRPFPDPFSDNRTVPGSFSHLDNRANPMDNNQSWNRNRFLEREPVNSNYVDDEMFRKRIRVDYREPGSFNQTQLQLSRLPSERNDYNANATRILNLIRDHGGYSGPQTQVGIDSSIGSRSSIGPAYGINRSFHGSSLNESRFDGLNAGEPVGFNEQRPSVVTNNFYASEFGSVGRNMPPLPREPVFNHQNQSMQGMPHDQNSRINDRSTGQYEDKKFYRGEYSLGFDQHRTQSNSSNGFVSDADHGYRNEQHGHGRFGQTDNFFHHPSQNYERSNNLTGALNHVDSDQQNQDMMNHIQEENGQHNMNWGERSILIPQQPQIPHFNSDHVPRDSREMISSYELQQVQQREFSYITPKPPQYPHPATWQAPLSPNGQFNEQRSSHMLIENHLVNSQSPQSVNTMQHHEENKHIDAIRPFQRPFQPYNLPVAEQSDAHNMKKDEFYPMMSTSNSMASQAFGVPTSYPPLPPQPHPMDQPGPPPSHLQTTSSPLKTTPICTGSFSSSVAAPFSIPQSIQAFPEVQPLPHTYFYNKPLLGGSTGFATETPSKQYQEEGPLFPVKHSPSDKLKVMDAALLFRRPHRATRPDHIVIILRGLPGSGKSYLAKTLRDLEVENGGKAPRIHSMDDYFMTEVEKDEESEGSKTSSSVKGKKRVTKKVMEYCYEPEMEEAYRSSMLKAFKKTLEEGIFTFIIVDDRNLRVADFAQFWATAKMSGYEVYLLEATYKDPMGCAARNVHGFTSDDIQKMADRWEQAPPLYLQLDVQSLFQGDDLNERGIQEVDMDMEEVSCDEHTTGVQGPKSLAILESPLAAYASDGSLKLGERWDAEEDDQTQEVKELGRSKWSEELDEDIDETECAKGHLSALSGLIHAYGKGEKSVHWGDSVGKSGFSIGAAKKPKILSLVIGPGSGYNLDSNPFAEEENVDTIERNSGESTRRSVFLEHLRAERESFKAVFDRRRQRIGGLEIEDEQ